MNETFTLDLLEEDFTKIGASIKNAVDLLRISPSADNPDLEFVIDNVVPNYLPNDYMGRPVEILVALTNERISLEFKPLCTLVGFTNHIGHWQKYFLQIKKTIVEEALSIVFFIVLFPCFRIYQFS